MSSDDISNSSSFSSGPYIVADDDDEKQSLIKEGYSNIVVTGKSDFNEVLRKSKDYQAGIESIKEYVEDYTAIEVLEAYIEKHQDVICLEAYEDFNEIIHLFLEKDVECGYGVTITKGEIFFFVN